MAAASATAACGIVIVVAVAIASTAISSTAAFAVIIVVATATAASAMATAATSTTATMRLVEQLVDGSFADLVDLTSEEERLACERVIEVQCDGVVIYAEHGADDVLPFVVEHWDSCAEFEELLA